MKNLISISTRRWLSFIIVLLFCTNFSFAQLATWSSSYSGITASPLNATTSATGLTSAQLARVNLTGTSSSTRFSSSAWNNTGNYLTITITASAGHALNLSGATVSLSMGSSATGPTSFDLRSSVDNYATSLGTLVSTCPSAQNPNSKTLPVSASYNGLSSIIFRVIGTQTGCSSTLGSSGTAGPSAITIGGTVVTAAIALSSANNPSIPAGNVVQNTAKNAIYNFQTAITNANATLNSVAFTTAGAGTYSAGDIAKFQLWYNSSANSLTGASQLGSDITTSLGAGSHTFSGLSQVINSGNTGFFFITADVTADAITSDNITVNGLTSTAVTFAAGTVTGSASAGGTQTIIVPASPSLSANSLTPFGNTCINTTAAPNSFTISGANLTNDNVTVGPLAGFTFSTTSAGVYAGSLSLAQPGGTYSQNIFVEFNPTVVQAYDNNIPVGGGGAATSVNVFAAGSGVNTPFTVATVAATNVTNNAATLTGVIINGCAPVVSAYGIEYSTTNGFANGTGIAVAGANLSGGNFSVNLANLTQGTTYYYHAFANNGSTIYGSQVSFTPNPYAIYQFTSTADGSPALVFPNLTGTNVTTVGFGTNTACGAGDGISGITVPSTITSYSPSNGTYADVDLTPASGYLLTVTNLSVGLRRSGTGPNNARLAYSTDGGVTWVDKGSDDFPNNGSCGVLATASWNLTALCGSGNGVTIGNPNLFKFRIYFFNASSSSGTLEIMNLGINGVVTNTCSVTASISGTTTICENSSTNITFTGSPNAKVLYTINGGTNQTINLDCSGGATLATGPLSVNTTYALVSAALGSCSQLLSGNAVVSLNPLPTMAATPISIAEVSGTIPNDGNLCSGDGVTLTANVATGATPYTYKWSGTLGTNSTAGFIPVSGSPSYTVTVTDNNGCTVTASKVLTVNPLPTPSINETDNSGLANSDAIICIGDAVNLSALPALGVTYNWGASLGTGQTATDFPITNTIYTVIATDVNGCSASASTGTITVNSLPTVNITPGATTLCSGDNVQLVASGTSVNYNWMPSGDLDNLAGSTVNASPATSGTFTLTSSYTVIGTDVNACSATANASVVVKPLPPLSVSPSSAVCTGFTTATLTASGASTYLWSPTDNLTPSEGAGATETAQISELTFYTVTGTGSNGCITNVIVPVATVATGGMVSPAFSIICSGGSKTLTVTGTAGHDYQWQISPDNTSWNNISGATNTTYSTAGSDGTANKFYRLMAQSNSCWNVASTTAEVDVSNPIIPIAVNNITDNGLTLNWSPIGTGNYNITYSGASSGLQTGVTAPKTLTGLTGNGTYNIIVTQTGVSGCSATGTLTGVKTLCAVPTNLTATPTTVGVTQQLTVSWNGPLGNYRVYYRPLYSAVTFYTKDVTNATSVVLSKQGNNNLYGSNTYQVYVASLDCPTTGAVGQPTGSIYVTTHPTTVTGCATPTIDTVFSTCPVLMEVQLHGGSGSYNVYIQRLTPTLQAVNSYGVSSGDFVINAAAGQQYLISADSKCGSVVSTLNIWHNTLTVKPICNAPGNLVLSNPTCHGFTASWNADQCISNTISGYALSMRVAGSVNFNSYSAPLPSAEIGPHLIVNWSGEGKNIQAFVRSVYTCGGSETYGPSSQTVSILTASAGCRDEDTTEQFQENKPAVQQYSADNQEVFSLYPNPNTGEFTVDLSRLSNNTDEVRIEVINMIGQTITTHITSISNGHMSEFMNLPNSLATGTYIVRLTVGKNVYTAKMNISK